MRSLPQWAVAAAAAAGGGALIAVLLRRWREQVSGQAELYPGLQASCTVPSPRRSKPTAADVIALGHVVIVGAGIVGLAIANELARRGCEVTVLEKEMAAGTQATALSWAWINANSKKPKHYQRFNMLAMDLWNLMFPGYVNWCGSLLLNENPKQEVDEYPCHKVEWSQVPDLQPGIACETLGGTSGTKSGCSYFPSEGITEPHKVINEMLRRAEARQVRLVYGATVTGFPWDIEGDVRGVTYVLHGSQGWDGPQTITADVVVLSNGTGVEQLAKSAGFKVPLLHKPGFLAHTEPVKDVVKRVIVSPNCHILQRENGSLVIGESKEAGGASSVAYAVDRYAHEGFRSNMPPASHSEEQEDEELAELSTFGHRALGAAKSILPVIEEAKLSRVTCGYRPFPEDGLPVIGFCSSSCSTRSPGLYIAVMHSGITLAPLAGAAAALEIAEGLDLDLLAPYRVNRFTKIFKNKGL
ncbi:hypothetical protein GUITHDRAFT_132116 [Guillardia theta CCMP2712]|uniref:FAD dependent oxidoreductase domain-containing protein n=1 Tax=Guillardia theta (strain CCMP2712) TaxID=905079 RepID=L1K1P8_GUITC|nr:hypothetical protein GUITHDRAFT_132116 [Guillardia theta CCMP2712]EKX54370.1 hypothetical protein GUITHDRAFT_132116 [Guillardia theta CCMP2712]|eukprot:XP_005841350.1 hypothetical protein GUITHDRAFT_132116 [Guillardia theta CCMP2712]